MKQLLHLGSQSMWWCPVCGRVLHKPPWVAPNTGERFHSWRCQKPMREVQVRVRTRFDTWDEHEGLES